MPTPDELTGVSLPKLKVPGMENQQPAPAGLDPQQGIKNLATDAARLSQGAVDAFRAQFAPQPAPTVAPMGGEGAMQAVLPTLQAGDQAMRTAGTAIGDATTQAGRFAVGAANDAGSAIAAGAQGLVDAGRAENQRIQGIDNTPTERPGTVMGGLSNLGSRIKNGLLDAGVLSPEIVSRGEILTPDQQHGVKPALPQASYLNEGRGAPAPAAGAPTPAGQQMSPAAAAYQKSVDDWKPAAGASEKLAGIVAGSQPQQVAAPAAQPAAGMPAPGSAYGADMNGAPAQQTAYWAQQKAGLQERERYADQQAQQQNAMAMMSDDQNFKREMFEYIKTNGEKLGPATLQALTGLGSSVSGASGPAGQGLAGLASMANHMSAAAGDAEKNSLTARGQDLTYAGHQLTGQNDMSKARLSADVTRDGYANRAAIQSASDAAADGRARVSAEAHVSAAKESADATRYAADSHGSTLPNGDTIYPGKGMVYRVGGKDPVTKQPIAAGMYPTRTFLPPPPPKKE